MQLIVYTIMCQSALTHESTRALHMRGGYIAANVERCCPPSDPMIVWCSCSPEQNLLLKAGYTSGIFVINRVLFCIGILLIFETNPKQHWSTTSQ